MIGINIINIIRISKILLFVSIFTFFMPMFSVSCGNYAAVSLSGADIAFGSGLRLAASELPPQIGGTGAQPALLALVLPTVVILIVLYVANCMRQETRLIIMRLLPAVNIVIAFAAKLFFDHAVYAAAEKLPEFIRVTPSAGYGLVLYVVLNALAFAVTLIPQKNNKHATVP